MKPLLLLMSKLISPNIPTASTVLVSVAQVRGARGHLLKEFSTKGNAQGTDALYAELEAQSRCTVRDRDGNRMPARYWRCSVAELWRVLNGEARRQAEARGSGDFSYEGKNYQRTAFFNDNSFVRELVDQLREETQCNIYTQEFEASNDRNGNWRPAETFLKFQVAH